MAKRERLTGWSMAERRLFHIKEGKAATIIMVFISGLYHVRARILIEYSAQITYSRSTTRTTGFMIQQPNDWCDESWMATMAWCLHMV